ncbi:hypothetical protein VV11_006725 [Trichodesmium erythraeum 21-75]|nr:hypothetical protein [Trichodesmium erythraeum 21-75]
MLNAYWKPLMFELPPLERGENWYLIVNTAFTSPKRFLITLMWQQKLLVLDTA